MADTDDDVTPGIRIEVWEEELTFTTEAHTTKMVPLHMSQQRMEAHVTYINALIEADEKRREHVRKAPPATDTGKRQPTNGLRVEVVVEPACRDHGDIARLESKRGTYAADPFQSTQAEISQAGVDGVYLNWLIETDERRRAAQAAEAAKPSDLIVDMGNLGDSRIDRIPLNEDYEAMVEDFIGTFNNAVLQGIRPMTAIYAMSQAFAVVLGFGLRANMPWAAAQEILKQQMQSATAASREVKIITSH